MPIIVNQINIKGPKALPTSDVPNCCIMNSKIMIAITIGTVSICGNLLCKPSIAEDIVMGGVMIPSASNAQPPNTAGTISHFALRRTNEKSENMPPSPLLSARKVITTYFKVVWSVNVQTISEMPPNISVSEIVLSPTMALKTYRGEVPISP